MPISESQRRDLYVIRIPEAPQSMNQGGGGSRAHYMAAAREKKRWQETFRQELTLAGVPHGMVYCDIDVRLSFKNKVPGGGVRDSTNYYAPVVKPLADALAPSKMVFAKLPTGKRIAIKNDAPRWLPDDTDEYLAVRVKVGVATVWPYHHPSIKVFMTLTIIAYY